MALTGSTQNKRPGAGVYAGAGVARGGQQGRPRAVHNGLGGAKPGGATPGASQPRPGSARPARQPVSYRRPAPAPIGTVPAGTPAPVGQWLKVVKNGKVVRMDRNKMSPELLRKALAMQMNKPGGGGAVGGGGAATGPAAAGPTAASPSPYVPQFAMHDSDYFMDLAGAQAGFDSELNPINSELERLRYKGVGGKTLYDTMFDRAQQDFNYSVRDTRGDHASRGIGRSGRFDRAAAGLADQWTQGQRGLDEQYGATAINRLETQAAQRRASFAQQKSTLEMAAAARAQQRLQDYNASIYGQTIMPEEG